MKKNSSNRKERGGVLENPFVSEVPAFPTTVTEILHDGRVRGTAEAGTWLYYSLPLSQIREAKTVSDRLAAADPLIAVVNALAAVTPLSGAKLRATSSGNYRKMHLLRIDIPRWFSPPKDHTNAALMQRSYSDKVVQEQVLLLGVKLKEKSITGFKPVQVINDIADFLGARQTPLRFFDEDYRKVKRIFESAGLRRPTPDELHLAKTWFTHGNKVNPPIYPYPNMLSVYTSEQLYAADWLKMRNENKYPDPTPVPGAKHTLHFAAVESYNPEYTEATSQRASWAINLLDAGALAISVTADIEPPEITRKVVDSGYKKAEMDIEERAESGKLDRMEQAQALADLAAISDLYGMPHAPATLMNLSTIVAFDREIENYSEVIENSALSLDPMGDMQQAALAETWLASNVTANPHRLEQPVTTLAYSGINEGSVLGDSSKGNSVLVGFSENGSIPTWYNCSRAYRSSTIPMTFVAGSSGTGKSTFMMWVSRQMADSGRPTMVIDMSNGADYSAVVTGVHDQVISLDDLLTGDGVFDPLRYSKDAEEGASASATNLLSINPWGRNIDLWEAEIQSAIKYGLDRGATCTGQALKIALENGEASPEMVEPIFKLHAANPQFRSMLGMDPTTEPIRVAQGLTYIRAGETALNLESIGKDPNLNERISAALLGSVVTASVIALRGRHGSVLFDEAHVLFDSMRRQLIGLSRVIRKYLVDTWFFTQRVSDSGGDSDQSLTEMFTRGFVMPLLQRDDAIAACKFLRIEATNERVGRINAEATISQDSRSDDMEGRPNWNSLRFLRDPETLEVLRGSMAYYRDLHGGVAPIEIVIPEWFLRAVSTDDRDIARRLAAEKSQCAS